jgi:hypothetical protein
MSEEKKEGTCPVFHSSGVYTTERCGAKLIRKEPVLSAERVIGHLYGPKDLGGGYSGREEDYYYMYECEKGHTIHRPNWYADVPIVPPGTMKTRPLFTYKGRKVEGTRNKLPGWYALLSEEEKEEVWKGNEGKRVVYKKK